MKTQLAVTENNQLIAFLNGNHLFGPESPTAFAEDIANLATLTRQLAELFKKALDECPELKTQAENPVPPIQPN